MSSRRSLCEVTTISVITVDATPCALLALDEMCAAVRKAEPTAAHRALAALDGSGRLLRHYTMNIDGLHAAAGMRTWHPLRAPAASTVELHGRSEEITGRMWSAGRVK